MHPINPKAQRRPEMKAPETSGETEPRLGSTPLNSMTVTTIVVARAMLTMLAEFRVRLVRAEITPYRERSTALIMELVLGE